MAYQRRWFGTALCAGAFTAMLAVSGCGGAATTSASTADVSSGTEISQSVATESVPQADGIAIEDTLENNADGEHAIEADGVTEAYANVAVNKTGEADGDEADFYGENAAVFATNGATLDLSQVVVKTDGTHANAVFSYGEGTTVNVSDSVIETSGNCSGGIMTTGGGTMNASNLNIHTTGNSSAAIRSDRGGGTVNVTGGSYTTDGTGSPVVYSTADITVSDAEMTSTASQGVVVEGKNSVTLNDVMLNASNTTKNSDKSDWYQAVMIYQSMSGDAAEGASAFTMKGGALTNENGDIFFVNNTVTTISLEGATIVNNDADGVFLRAAAAGWGNEGSNGGQVTLKAADQAIDGDMLVDDVSNLNLYLSGKSAFTGAINPDGEAGDVYVELDEGSTWKLTGDSYISSLTCDADAIDLNGHALYVDGKAYEAESASTGSAIEVVVSSASQGGPGDGSTPPEGAPDGGGPGDGGTPPQKPGGNAGDGGTPPQKPGEEGESPSSGSDSSSAASSSES